MVKDLPLQRIGELRQAQSGMVSLAQIAVRVRGLPPSGAAARFASGIDRRLLRRGRRLAASLTLKMAALLVMFAALPVVLYGQFAAVDRREQSLVAAAVEGQTRMVAQALAPLLKRTDRFPDASLDEALNRHRMEGTVLRLLLRPSGIGAAGGFHYIASSPEVSVAGLAAESAGLVRHDIPAHLSASCAGNMPLEVRYDRPEDGEQILTSVVPIHTAWGCWVLMSDYAASALFDAQIRQPYWESRSFRVAAAICSACALLAVLTAFSLWRSVRHFRGVAREIRQGRIGHHSFAERNRVPEFATVADDFDRLVLALHGVGHDIRRTAEDNAHSFKTPLATIQTCVETLRRAGSDGDLKTRRTMHLIDRAVERLRALVNAAQRLDNNTADLIEVPRTHVNLAQLVADVLLGYGDLLRQRGIRVARHLDGEIEVWAARRNLEIALENILDNAVSFSPPDAIISVTLRRENGSALLDIEDEGPGIDPKKLDRIFERYFSLRPNTMDGEGGERHKPVPQHAGLGLWIVRRNVEAIGGRVSAANRVDGGFIVSISLPISDE
jgi:two-component system sensor histidine kinase ChvG